MESIPSSQFQPRSSSFAPALLAQGKIKIIPFVVLTSLASCAVGDCSGETSTSLVESAEASCSPSLVESTSCSNFDRFDDEDQIAKSCCDLTGCHTHFPMILF